MEEMYRAKYGERAQNSRLLRCDFSPICYYGLSISHLGFQEPLL